jgi:hypothetical protein
VCGDRVLAGLVQAAREPATRRAAPSQRKTPTLRPATARLRLVCCPFRYRCLSRVPSPSKVSGLTLSPTTSTFQLFLHVWQRWHVPATRRFGIFSSAAFGRACGSAARKPPRSQQDKREYCGLSSRDLFG